jgi:hypothetical protein
MTPDNKRQMVMKQLASYLLISLFALPLLSGCAAKATWLPLWTAPPPGATTEIASGEPGDPEATPQPDYFTTDVEAMESPRVVVNKSEHALEVYDGSTLMARIKVALGRSEGAKRKSGDNKTPEGDYFICSTSESEKYYKSLFLSYPNSDDAYAGLNDGVIQQEQYDEISSATDRREQPPWDTKLGGEIAICGSGTTGQGKTGDWTGGNIVVSDKDMDYLWKYIKEGVDVQINP